MYSARFRILLISCLVTARSGGGGGPTGGNGDGVTGGSSSGGKTNPVCNSGNNSGAVNRPVFDRNNCLQLKAGWELTRKHI